MSLAEQRLLGAILVRPPLLHRVTLSVAAADISDPAMRALFETLTELDGRGDELDLAAIERHLREVDKLKLVGGVEALARVSAAGGVDAPLLLDSIVGVVQTDALRRRSIHALRTATDDLRGCASEDLATTLHAARQVLDGLAPTPKRPGLRAVLQESFELLTRRVKGERLGVDVGFPELDEMTCGFQPGDLIILGARPSMGKTALALAWTDRVAVAGSMPTLVFSREMSTRALLERLAVSRARVDYHRFRSGVLTRDMMTAIVCAFDDLANAEACLAIDDATSDVDDLVAVARSWRPESQRAPDNPALVVIDYLQLVRCREKKASREQEVAHVSERLKSLAKELQCPVLALSQLNRGLESRSNPRPVLSDLRESGAVEQDADLVLFVHRPERFLEPDATDEQRRKVAGLAELIVAKQRNGPIGTVYATFVADFATFFPGRPAQP